jgi:hypothetical protein
VYGDGAAVDDGGVGPRPARPNDPAASALCQQYLRISTHVLPAKIIACSFQQSEPSVKAIVELLGYIPLTACTKCGNCHIMEWDVLYDETFMAELAEIERAKRVISRP